MRLGSLVFSTVLLTIALAAAPAAGADATARPVPVEGRVVDRQGDPVRGASVVAVDVQDRARQLIAKTSADGRFEATLAPKGRFYVEVCEGSGRAGCAALPSLLPVYVGPDERAVTPLLLTSYFPRGERRIDLGRVALRHRAARLTVTVDAGRPSVVHIMGAEPRERGVVPERPWAALDGRRSGGVRRIGGLVPGAYDLQLTSYRRSLGPSTFHVELTAGANRVDLSGPGPSVSGTVTHDGGPVAEGRVRLQRTSPAGSVGYGSEVVVRTDAQGRYVVDAVPTGTYRVSVGGPGEATPYAVADARVPGRRSQVTADLATDTAEAGRITGTAPPAAGQTAEQRAQQVVSVRDIGGDPELARPVGEVPVDPVTGAFVVDGLPAGEYGLESFWTPDHPSWTTVTVAAGDTAEATFDPPPVGAGRLTIDLPPDADGVDLARREPAWAPERGRPGTWAADDQGRVVLDDFPFGTYDAQALNETEFVAAPPRVVGFTDDGQTVTIERGPRYGELAGVLTLPSGRPAPRPGVLRSVFCQRLGGGGLFGQDLGRFYTRRGATFGSPYLRPGTWVCRPEVPPTSPGRAGNGTWRLPYYYPPSAPFDVRPGEVTHLDLPLRPRKP